MPELKSVTVTAESKKLKVGEETTVTAKVDPTDAKDVTITWKTSDATVLKVDEAGKVTALKAGKATITATAVQGEKKVTDSVEIEVEEEVKPEPTPELKSVTVTAESKKLKVGEETTVTAKVDPTDAKDVTVTWKTSDETVLVSDSDFQVFLSQLSMRLLFQKHYDLMHMHFHTLILLPYTLQRTLYTSHHRTGYHTLLTYHLLL